MGAPDTEFSDPAGSGYGPNTPNIRPYPDPDPVHPYKVATVLSVSMDVNLDWRN